MLGPPTLSTDHEGLRDPSSPVESAGAELRHEDGGIMGKGTGLPSDTTAMPPRDFDGGTDYARPRSDATWRANKTKDMIRLMIYLLRLYKYN